MAVRRSDGRWQASARHAGKRYTFYGTTSAQAEGDAEVFRQKVRGHTAPGLDALMPEWLATKQPVTRESYERLWRLYLAPLGRVPMTALTVQDCQAAVDRAPAGSRRKALAVLRAALNDAVRQGDLQSNPARLVRVPGYEPKGKAMSRAEAQAMLAHAGRYESLYRTALGTGLRLGELLALTPEDYRNGKVIVRKSKTKAGLRTVPVPPGIEFNTATADWLFTSSRGQCKATHVRQRLYVACDRAGIERYRFHDLRHSFATMALGQGIPLHVVSKIMGHSSIAVTADVYSHVSLEDVNLDKLAL